MTIWIDGNPALPPALYPSSLCGPGKPRAPTDTLCVGHGAGAICKPHPPAWPAKRRLQAHAFIRLQTCVAGPGISGITPRTTGLILRTGMLLAVIDRLHYFFYLCVTMPVANTSAK